MQEICFFQEGALSFNLHVITWNIVEGQIPIKTIENPKKNNKSTKRLIEKAEVGEFTGTVGGRIRLNINAKR